MLGTRCATCALAVLLTAWVLVLSGCGDSLTMSDLSDAGDTDILEEFIADDEIFDDAGPYEGTVSYVEAGTRAEIDPLAFWREVTEIECFRQIVVDQDSGTAEAAIERDVWGLLHIVDADSIEYEKPFHHSGLRYANFIRDDEWEAPNGPPDDAGNGELRRHRRGPWELTEVSGFLAASDTCTVSIDWIRVQSASVDTTISDPLALMSVPDGIMMFEEGDEVTVTVSGPAEGDVVVLHTRRFRAPLEYAEGTFGGTWIVERPGSHTAWIEALAHDSLYDSEYPEDTLIWGMPYDVAEEVIED